LAAHVSVVVCTCNRSESLRQALQSMKRQNNPMTFHWELIVVDNDSVDDTRKVVQEFLRDAATLQIKYLFEKKRGKSYALNCGIKASEGNVLVFTDDDCVVELDWLASIVKEFESDPSLAVLGGRVELYDERDRPVTVRRFRSRIPLVSTAQLFNLIPGCNMAVRREVFERVGEFDVSFGPGTAIVVDDVDFVYRAFMLGFKIVYSPEVLVYHNHGRRTDRQQRAIEKAYVIGRGAFYCKHIISKDRNVLKMAYWEICSLMNRTFKNLAKGSFSGCEARFLVYLFNGAARQIGKALFNRVSVLAA
jgi:GT2 family glycosyltransferase